VKDAPGQANRRPARKVEPCACKTKRCDERCRIAGQKWHQPLRNGKICRTVARISKDHAGKPRMIGPDPSRNILRLIGAHLHGPIEPGGKTGEGGSAAVSDQHLCAAADQPMNQRRPEHAQRADNQDLSARKTVCFHAEHDCLLLALHPRQ